MTGGSQTEYVLNGSELMLLLGGQGVRSFVGFALNTEGISRQEALNTLWRMSRRGLVRAEGEGFALEAGLDAAVKHMAAAERVVLVRSAIFDSGTICAYLCGDDCVTVQPSAYAKEQYSVARLVGADWVEKLIAGGALPVHYEANEGEEQEETCQIARAVANVEVYSAKTQRLEKRFGIFDHLTSYTIELENGSQRRFSVEEFINQTRLELEEENGNGGDKFPGFEAKL
ncbi:MAG: hypothetical protein Q4C01_04425 [Clostridia bacterium]|nr:hypothetical protein [Clostridia bacterium]